MISGASVIIRACLLIKCSAFYLGISRDRGVSHAFWFSLNKVTMLTMAGVQAVSHAWFWSDWWAILNRRAPITWEHVGDMAVQQVLFMGVEPVLISPFDCVLQKDGPRWGSLGMWKLIVMGERKNGTNEPVYLIPRVSKKPQALGFCCRCCWRYIRLLFCFNLTISKKERAWFNFCCF